MISVIIPVFNAERTVEDCVRSVCCSADNDTDYEIILVDDGSKDNGGYICDILAKSNDRIKVYHQRNLGVSTARNIGLENAKGEYICFVDSDDKVASDYLRIINKEAPTADIVFFGFVKVWETRQDKTRQDKTRQDKTRQDNRISKKCDCLPKPIDTLFTKPEIEDNILSLYNSDGINYFGFTWSKVFRANIIRTNKLLFNPQLRIKEDEIFTLQYCQHISSLKVLDKSLYEYTIWGSSLSHCGSTEINYEYLASVNEAIGCHVSSKGLKQFLLDLSVSYKLSNVQALIAKGIDKKNILNYIRQSIIPLLRDGYGLNASRWIKLVYYALNDRLRTHLIYSFLRR